MPVTTFDVWDQAALTNQITRPPLGRAPGAAEDNPTLLGEQIAPLVPHAGRKARVRVAEIKPFGKGQFRAPDATPAFFKPSVEYTDYLIEMALLDEMERIPEEEWLLLNSADENLVRSAGVDLITRGRILELRNLRATEWMRWQAFLTGKLTITYDTGATLLVDYGLPSGHVLTVSTLWSDTTNADPVADIQAWSEKIADDSGFYGQTVHMNSKTYNYLIQNAKIKNAINFYAPSANTILRPRREDLLNLFTVFAQNVGVVIYDNGYRDTGATGIGRPSLTKYLPDGKVLMTGPYTIDGTRIADMLDGQVTVGVSYNTVAIRQGFQTEVMLDHISKNHFLRAASARIPRLLIPEAFLAATVA